MKNQLGQRKLINLRAFTIGISAAFLALACSGSEDGGNNNNDPVDQPDVQDADNDPPSSPGRGDNDGPLDPPGSNNNEDDDDPPVVDLNNAFVESLLQSSCGQCHGNEAASGGSCSAGMCYIEDIDALIENGKIVPGNPAESPLFRRISATDGSVMPPPGSPRPLSSFEIQQIEDFINRLEEPVRQVCDNQFITWDEIYRAIQADLIQLDQDDVEFTRYLSISNRYNAGVCDQDLEFDRFAMSKFINSVSQENGIRRPREVAGTEKTVYRIDLRDYALDESEGPFIVDGEVFVDGWEAIIGNNQYAVEFQGDQADAIELLTGTLVPVMFSDAVIDEASFGNLYYGLLQLPETRDELLLDLDIDLADDLDNEITLRAGTTESEISQQERLVQRNPQGLANGLYYYESFDLDPDIAGNSIFANPLAFDADANGSEAVFSLPNGLQAYIIFDENGDRLEESPILFDQATQNDNVMRAGVSCSNCHAQGLIPFDDQVRSFVDDNQLDAAAAAAAVGGEFEDILDLYPGAEEFKDILADDSQTFLRALSAAGVPTAERSDPIARTFVRFDLDVDLVTFAGDLHFPPNQLEREINRLDPDLSGLDDGFRVDRDDIKGLYVNSLCIVGVFNENRPEDQACIDAGAI